MARAVTSRTCIIRTSSSDHSEDAGSHATWGNALDASVPREGALVRCPCAVCIRRAHVRDRALTPPIDVYPVRFVNRFHAGLGTEVERTVSWRLLVTFAIDTGSRSQPGLTFQQGRARYASNRPVRSLWATRAPLDLRGHRAQDDICVRPCHFAIRPPILDPSSARPACLMCSSSAAVPRGSRRRLFWRARAGPSSWWMRDAHGTTPRHQCTTTSRATE